MLGLNLTQRANCCSDCVSYSIVSVTFAIPRDNCNYLQCIKRENEAVDYLTLSDFKEILDVLCSYIYFCVCSDSCTILAMLIKISSR